MYHQLLAGFFIGSFVLNGLTNVTANSVLEDYGVETMNQEKVINCDFVTPNGMNAEEFETYCEDYFVNQYEKEIPGISLAVVSHGKVVYEKGFGYRNMEE